MDEFRAWWGGLTEGEQVAVGTAVGLLIEDGPSLSFPHSTKIDGSRHSAMRELRAQHQGCPYRVLYIFDSRRAAILLLGGDKTGDDRWYEKNVPRADRIYDQYLQELQRRKTMPNLTKWSELESKMSPDARVEVSRRVQEELRKMPLHELRAARRLTQQQLAQTLDMSQAAVSQLEQRTDIYLSTLENFVEAMGGRLEMYAVFPDGKVRLGLEREAS